VSRAHCQPGRVSLSDRRKITRSFPEPGPLGCIGTVEITPGVLAAKFGAIFPQGMHRLNRAVTDGDEFGL
jgi:hypothetical protein